MGLARFIEVQKRNIRRIREKRFQREMERTLAGFTERLYFRDRNGFMVWLRPDLDYIHILAHRTTLDGQVEELVKRAVERRGGASPGIAMDIGANIGSVSLLLAPRFRQVYTFEPSRESAETIRHNLEINGITNVEVVQAAMADRSGKATFNMLEGHAHSSLLDPKTSRIVRSVEVDVLTLDQFCAERGIDEIELLKVDVEGAEPEVFNGARRMLTEGRIRNLIFEISAGVMQRLGRDVKDIMRPLAEAGYGIYDPKGRRVSPDGKSTSGLQDLIAYR